MPVARDNEPGLRDWLLAFAKNSAACEASPADLARCRTLQPSSRSLLLSGARAAEASLRADDKGTQGPRRLCQPLCDGRIQSPTLRSSRASAIPGTSGLLWARFRDLSPPSAMVRWVYTSRDSVLCAREPLLHCVLSGSYIAAILSIFSKAAEKYIYVCSTRGVFFVGCDSSFSYPVRQTPIKALHCSFF